VIYPGSSPVGNATLVVANVLTCNKYSPICAGLTQVLVVSCAASVGVLENNNFACVPCLQGCRSHLECLMQLGNVRCLRVCCVGVLCPDPCA
jgi:hypothetical protein